ncbi:hypothetical protein KNCP2_05000 [Candidatus Rickettsia kedanie]|uniref:Uncharacterized protein n=1 Tax=Candidatus Rickettsia kedanie TaxID=3115352 RepID=A0ABP9TVK6_9RICK
MRDISKPIGLAGYKITENLPDEIKSELPTIEELELICKNILIDN